MTSSGRPALGLRATVAEALTNIRSVPTYSVVLGVVAALVGAAGLVLTTSEVSGIVARHEERVRHGITVLSVTAEERATFDGARCDQLNAIPGVVAAGGIVSTVGLAPTLGPDATLTIVTVTSRYPRVMWPDEPSVAAASTVAGSAVASRDGLVPGAIVRAATTVDEIAVRVEAVAGRASPRDPHVDDRLVVVAQPASPIVECLVEAAPAARADVERLLLGWFDSAERMYVSPYFVASTLGRTPQQELEGRISRFVPFVGGVVLALTFLAGWFGRRADIALYRLLGVSRGRIALMLSSEFVVLAWLPIAIATTAVALVGGRDLPRLAIDLAVLDISRLAAISVLVPLIGVGILERMTSIESLKGR